MDNNKKEQAKVVSMPANKSFQVKTEMIKGLMPNTDYRVQISKLVDKKQKYHFRVEKLDMLKEWDKFHAEFLPKYNNATTDFIEVSESEFNKIVYFIYFFGSLYKHNGERPDDKDSQDGKYVLGSYLFLYETIKFTDGEEFDWAIVFSKAFGK